MKRRELTAGLLLLLAGCGTKTKDQKDTNQRDRSAKIEGLEITYADADLIRYENTDYLAIRITARNISETEKKPPSSNNIYVKDGEIVRDEEINPKGFDSYRDSYKQENAENGIYPGEFIDGYVFFDATSTDDTLSLNVEIPEKNGLVSWEITNVD